MRKIGAEIQVVPPRARNDDQPCDGDNAVCDSAAGAGDGVCDACPLTGGFRTKDEMFILFGNFWVE